VNGRETSLQLCSLPLSIILFFVCIANQIEYWHMKLPYMCTNYATYNQLQLAKAVQVDITPTWSMKTTEQFHVSYQVSQKHLWQCAIHIHQTERVGTVLSVTTYVHETVPMFVICTCTLLVSIHHLLQLSWFGSTCSL